MPLVILYHLSWWGRRGRPDAFLLCNLLLQDVLQFGIERIELHLYRSECSAHFINSPAFTATKGGIHTYRPHLSKLVEQVLTFLLRRGNLLLDSLGFLLEERHGCRGGTLSAGRDGGRGG